MSLSLFFYLLAVIAFALVMLGKHVIGLAGIELLGGGFFCLALGLMLGGVAVSGTGVTWTR